MKKYKLILYSTIFSVFFLSNANSVSLPDFTELAEKYAPSVVNILSEKKVEEKRN